MPADRAKPVNDRNVGILLAEVNRLARREFDRRVRPLGLTRAQWLFLYYLGQRPGATQSELAELMQMERISVSRQADRLERAGWIERRDSAADARAYRLRLTPRAARVFTRLENLAEGLRSDYLQGLPPGRRLELFEDLSLIKANLLRLQPSPRHPLS